MIRTAILTAALAFAAGLILPNNGLLIVAFASIVAGISVRRIEVQR